jgi:C-terminal peptidase prc
LIGGGVAGLVLGLGLGVVVGRWTATRRAVPVTTASVFQDVLSAIRQSFVDSLSDDDLYVKAAKGVVTTLGDPYSSFLAPAEFREYREVLRGRGRSIGFTVADGPTGVRVATVFQGSAADRAGVAIGQFLVEVAGRSTVGLGAARVEALLRADSGPVRLRLRPPGDSIGVDFSIEAEATRLPAVHPALRLSDRVGYVALRAVSEQSSRQLAAALDRLDAGRLDGLLLDLRGNPGGRLDEGLAIADLFLEPGRRIGGVAKRRAFAALYTARDAQPYPRLRLVVLVDGRTASSAEIVAAALRDNDRARLVGQRTLGKGLIQTTIPLGDSVAVRLSTGRWRSPSGGAIEGGLIPDSVIEVPASRLALMRALQARSDLVATRLEPLARRRVAPPADSVAALLDEATLSRLETAWRREGLRLRPGSLRADPALLELEIRRLSALLRGDTAAATALGLLADPVVSGGMAALEQGSGVRNRGSGIRGQGSGPFASPDP